MRRRTSTKRLGRTVVAPLLREYGYALSGIIAGNGLREIRADVCSELGGDPARW